MARPPKYTHKEIVNLIEAYFGDCDANDKPYTISGLCEALDIVRDTLHEWEHAGKGSCPELADVVKKAKQRIIKYAESKLYSGKQTIGAIFHLKSLDRANWGDKVEMHGKIDNQVSLTVTVKRDNPAIDTTAVESLPGNVSSLPAPKEAKQENT